MATRTYTVGDKSGVKRLDELTGSWQSVPLNLLDNMGQDLNIILYDVMTDPLDSNKVFVCGQRNSFNGNPGIFWSANGGVTWNKCVGDVAGTVNQGSEIRELWVVDSNVIYATSSCGYVFKSTDGGVTFNHTAGNPGDINPAPGWFAGNCEIQSKAIHFIDANVGVVGMGIPGSSYMCKTVDGGANWTFVDLGALTVIGDPNGIHLDATQNNIVITTGSGLWYSNDAAASFDQKSLYRLLHLTWVSDLILWAYGQGSGRIQSTDGGVTWNILNAQSGSLRDRAGHHYDTAPPHDGFFAENADIFSTSDSSQTGTLSEANQFPGGIQAVWTGISDEQQIIPGCTDPTATNFNPAANADCLGVLGGTDLSCCTYEPGPPPDQPCECPVGYTYNADTDECERTETTPANCLPNTYFVRKGDPSPSYSSNGTNFYPDVTSLPYPLTDIIAPANPNVNNLQDGNLTPLLAITNVQSALWGGVGSGGRLYDAGVWPDQGTSGGDTLPVNEWVGFTACVVVPTSGTYSIGFGGDNRVRLRLDGNDFAEVGAIGGIYSYTYWSVVEITLSAGTHILEIEGYNAVGGSGAGPAAFAAEIYAADVNTLMGLTTPGQLGGVTVWTTAEFIPAEGTAPFVPFDLGEQSGCSCPDGWILSNCDGELLCVRTDIVPATPCNCYLATNCEEPADTFLFTIDPSLPPLDLNATYEFNEFPDKCWTIEESSDCGATTTDPILLNTGFIDASNTLGVEDDQDFNWELIVESDDNPITPRPAIVSDQTWFTGYGSIFNALWLTQTVSPHPSAGGFSEYRLQFNLPAGFIPSLVLDLLTDNTAVVSLNGNIIGDTSNPITYPTPWVTPAQFTTTNPAFFNTGANELIVRVKDSDKANQTNGFVLAGAINSLATADPSIPVTVREVFVDCDTCLGVCYELVDCEGILETKETDTDLSAYVGQVITIASCPDTCWTVNELEACPLVPVQVTLVNNFVDCVSCLPAPEPEPPLVIRNRPVKPGYDTPGCSPEYVEKINCDWSEALFQQSASKRYGIAFCCELDLQKLDIKKQMLDFKMITDPEACKTIVEPECCPPCNVEAMIHVFGTISCDAPTNVDAVLDVPNPVVQPNCIDVTLTAKGHPGISYPVTGTDCCGNPIDIRMTIGEVMQICVDLDQPYSVDPNINVLIGTNCDCDPNPPFDCYLIQPLNTSTDAIGSFTGNDCDGNPFDISIPPSTEVAPICVRADGLHTKSPFVNLTNLGPCP